MHTEPSHRSRALGFREFLVLTAAIMACQAIAVDTMLPSLPAIGNDLGVTDLNRTQWVITIYIAGVGIGQFFGECSPTGLAEGRCCSPGSLSMS